MGPWTIYWVALIVLSCLAVLNPRGRWMALILLGSWAFAWIMVEGGGFKWLPYGEAAAFYALLFALIYRPTRAGLAVVLLSILTLVVHVLYGLAYGLRLDFGQEYMYALNGLFMASMAVLSPGGWHELRSRVGAFLEGLGGAAGDYARPRHVRAILQRKEAGAK